MNYAPCRPITVERISKKCVLCDTFRVFSHLLISKLFLWEWPQWSPLLLLVGFVVGGNKLYRYESECSSSTGSFSNLHIAWWSGLLRFFSHSSCYVRFPERNPFCRLPSDAPTLIYFISLTKRPFLTCSRWSHYRLWSCNVEWSSSPIIIDWIFDRPLTVIYPSNRGYLELHSSNRFSDTFYGMLNTSYNHKNLLVQLILQKMADLSLWCHNEHPLRIIFFFFSGCQ